jgi:hypothetical protein
MSETVISLARRCWAPRAKRLQHGAPARCQAPQNRADEKRLSISTIFAAPLPFELPAIMWL